MRNFVANILRNILAQLARATIWRYRPGVIGVTGSVGKTSTKRAIAAVFANGRNLRASEGNLNNELGVALTILGEWRPEELFLVSHDCPAGTRALAKCVFWIKVMWVSLFRLLVFRAEKYPEILILEYGVDRPGDMRKLLTMVRPNLSIITAVGDIPVHVEFFSGPEELAREKAKLIEYLPTAGFAILNYDDDTVLEFKNRTRAHTVTFGFSKGAEMRITNFETRSQNGEPKGISFTLEYAGVRVPVTLEGVFGKAQAYAAAAATCVGLAFGMNLVRVAEALRGYRAPEGRGTLLRGIKETYCIDDTYNASPLSMHAALDTLRQLPGKRKVAVLGDMLELGPYAIEAHQHLGEFVASVADVLVTVGPRAKFIGEAARTKGMHKKNVLLFDTAEDAAIPVQHLIKKGDLILIKGSHAIGLEKVVEEIKAI